MAKASAYQFLDLARPVIPYRSYTSPVDEQPHFIPGAKNVLGTQIGYLEKRPGFSTPIEPAPTTVPGKIVRIFPWRRWGGAFYVMLCTIDSGVAKVYKLQQGGLGGSFTLIWSSTSATPFDFVVSDNFCFFGNGTDMRKFDGTTVSKWGTLDSGVAPVIAFQQGNLPAGLTFNSSTGAVSGTPTTVGTTSIVVTGTDSTGAIASQTFQIIVQPRVLSFLGTASFNQQAKIGTAFTTPLNAQFGTPGYTFTLQSGTLPTGLSITAGTIAGTPTGPAGLSIFALKVTDSLGATATQSFSIYVSTAASLALTGSLNTSVIGDPSYSSTLTATGGTGPYTFSVSTGIPDNTPHVNGGLAGVPPGITFTTTGTDITFAGVPTQIGTWTFYIDVQDSTGLDTRLGLFTIPIEATALTLFPNSYFLPGFVGSAYFNATYTSGAVGSVTFSFTAGTLNAQSGYIWGYSYTTIYGHESNVSPLSTSTGPFTNLDAAVTVIASSDSQVTGINIYRTTDGGTADPAIMRLLAQLPNTNQTFVDGIQDVNLGLQTGPGFLVNTPPTPCRGLVWSNGRIYGFTNNTSYYSGAEEVSNGIQEECWPSGLDGNFYAWPSEIGGAGVTQNGVDIGLSEQFWQVSGDTLDTFRKALLLDKAGTRSPTCISSVGNSVQWVDTAKQIWSSSLGEFGEPIRPDLNNIDPNQTFIGYHKSKLYNWIYVLDALGGFLYIYDLDLNQWNTPWTVAATAIASGETSLGNLSLLAAFNGRVMVLTPGTYLDAGNTYEDDFKIGLLPISPGRLTSARSKIEPTQVEEVQFETNSNVLPSFVGQLGDEDPIVADLTQWTELTAYQTTPQFIPPGTFLIQQRYISDSNTNPAIRTAFWVKFAPVSTGWKIYSFTISWTSA